MPSSYVPPLQREMLPFRLRELYVRDYYWDVMDIDKYAGNSGHTYLPEFKNNLTNIPIYKLKKHDYKFEPGGSHSKLYHEGLVWMDKCLT